MTHEYPVITVVPASESDTTTAHELSVQTGLPLQKKKSNAWHLLVDRNELKLQRPDGVSVTADFAKGAAARRTTEPRLAQQPLPRALGLVNFKRKHNQLPEIIDGTAGFGTDAWMLANLGCSVLMLEQSTVMSALLSNAVALAQQNPRHEKAAQRMQVLCTEATTYLQNRGDASTDIVYLDPMYPDTDRHALVKKGMQVLHELVGPDNNDESLLTAALAAARYRVVVKRPAGAQHLAGSSQWCGQLTEIKSPNTRFDVYHTHQCAPPL